MVFKAISRTQKPSAANLQVTALAPSSSGGSHVQKLGLNCLTELTLCPATQPNPLETLCSSRKLDTTGAKKLTPSPKVHSDAIAVARKLSGSAQGGLASG